MTSEFAPIEVNLSEPSAAGLAGLRAQVLRDLERLGHPAPSWTIAPAADANAPRFDVVIVGAGMCGLTVAFALLRRAVHNIRILDRSEAGREGPWLTYARMRTLRSPKHLAGPAMGVPSLTFRAWFEACWGQAACAALDRIPREMWMDYLRWYRDVLSLPVENGVQVVQITALGGEQGGRRGIGKTWLNMMRRNCWGMR